MSTTPAARGWEVSLSSATRPRAAVVDEAVRTVAGLALWVGLLLVAYWWVRDGGLGALGSAGAALTGLGQLSGLVGSVLLLAQVLLMARIPALERAFGQDRLAGLHRTIGFTSFNLVLVHVLTVTWGYAAGSLLAVPTTLWELTWDYPGMLLAAAATLCLVLVVVTSVRAARRRLRYESWHLMHLYAYLGVGLALPHQLWTGGQFTASSARTVFWWGTWIVAAGAVLAWRVGLPVVVNLRHRLRVTSVVGEAPGVWSVYVTGRRLDLLRVEPGQFLTWRFLGAPGRSRAHPYSLSAAPDGCSLRITVADAGDGSRDVATLRPGTRAFVEGPYGRLSPRAREAGASGKVAFLGAGVGITPLRSLLEGMAYPPGAAVYVERYQHTPLFAAEVDQIAAERGARVLRLPGRRRADGSWLPHLSAPVDDVGALRGWIPDVAERDLYVCGPPAWTESVRAAARAAGVPDRQLHIEKFEW
ncbi:putative ferric reductase [Nocardioides aromaticivorans]|uniref:Putative ferric reductase n=1 Tax=Nocardioides aromaticivorans TaxID=200618 RepID=A0A7Y9ZK12_9ACTN|nr:ferredoxin reductase family protein [Nocardioides aromaticivorans]NYI45758.1 putative ferric reductase [Nocardioides aromaticivorans]